MQLLDRINKIFQDYMIVSVILGKMILAKRLKAIKVGREWLIDPKDLDAVKDRKVGRPRKARKIAKR